MNKKTMMISLASAMVLCSFSGCTDGTDAAPENPAAQEITTVSETTAAPAETETTTSVTEMTEPAEPEEPPLPGIVVSVMANQNLWEGDLSFSEPSAVHLWFQDVDIDGAVEFVTGPVIRGAHGCNTYYVWEYKNHTLQRAAYSYDTNMQDSTVNVWPGSGGILDDTGTQQPSDFRLFFNNENGHFQYLNISQDGNATTSYTGLDMFDCTTKTRSTIFSLSELYTGSTASITYQAGDANVTPQEFKAQYQTYADSLTPYNTAVLQLRFSDYAYWNDAERQRHLMNSYNAWSYGEALGEAMPGLNGYAATIPD
ncbi:MAG: hypothetical protein MJ071_09060 [Oscillospiraceae bacterium]|nr:hypothetical protein [Oscillospiraceae bacterium]